MNEKASRSFSKPAKQKRQSGPKASRGRSLRTKIIVIALIAIIALVSAGCIADRFVNADKIYRGVSVGDVDVSGLTVREASTRIDEAYSERMSGTRVIIYASEDFVGTVDVETELLHEAAVGEQISVEEARDQKRIWVVDGASYGVGVASEDLAEEAYLIGRDNGGILSRITAMLFGKDLDVRCQYDEEALDNLMYDIDVTLGTPLVDYDVTIKDGVATVITGQDGNCLNRDEFIAQLDSAFLDAETADPSFVAHVKPSSMRITPEQAQQACDYLNVVLKSQVSFVYEGEGWGISRAALAKFVKSEIVESPSGYALNLLIDESVAKPAIVSFTNAFIGGRNVRVDFEKSGKDIVVLTDGDVELPDVEGALAALDEALFGTYRSNIGLKSNAKLVDGSYVAEDMSMVQINIKQGSAGEELSFEEALDLGLITAVSSFTTQYNNFDTTQNRVHNIHLAADYINNGIVQSNGGTWSFNDRAGNCNADRGFLGAGVIYEDEIQDAVGGGICQVATTVFNAVYEAGYGIDTRYNHTLYLEAYPAGRDAAVSFPDLDLVWRNDTDSDVLLCSSHTDNTITITLYGVDPGYEVAHSEGEWRKTKDHATKKVVDEQLGSGQSYVEVEGTDAMQFVVFRTVTNAAGDVVYDDTFYSSYGSVTEVIRVASDYKDTEATADKSEEGDQ